MYTRLIHTKYLYKTYKFNYKLIIFLKNNTFIPSTISNMVILLASMFEYYYIKTDI